MLVLIDAQVHRIVKRQITIIKKSKFDNNSVYENDSYGNNKTDNKILHSDI